MREVLKVCRVCGKEYEACRSAKISNTFRWQDVACSPKCGAVYLSRIQISRGIETTDCSKKHTTMYNEYVNGFCDEPDTEYETEFGSDE